MTLRLPSGENLAPPARMRRLETGLRGKEERSGEEEEEGWGGEKREEKWLKCRLGTGRMEGCHAALSVTGLKENR